jgi:hypothetical protein
VIPLVVVSLLLILAPPEQTRKLPKAPEAFSASAQVTGTDSAQAAFVRIFIDTYTTDKDRDTMVSALKGGGYPSFLQALRNAPVVGRLEMGDKSWKIRWARQQDAGPTRRVIVVATDQPVFFVGGGAVDAKPRAGYELGLVQFEIDDAGLGKGTMAAAAKVKLGEPTGVQVDDYGTKPIQLTSVTKIIS